MPLEDAETYGVLLYLPPRVSEAIHTVGVFRPWREAAAPIASSMVFGWWETSHVAWAGMPSLTQSNPLHSRVH